MSTQSAPYRPERLPDRYIREVVRRLPEDQRADIAAELGASLADRVESLRDEPPALGLEEAERVALVELGDPVLLASEYSGRRLQLIGSGLYPVYWRVLKAAMSTALLTAVGLYSAFSGFSEPDGGSGYVGGLVSVLVTVVVQVAFWVTVVFAVIERVSGPSTGRWTPEDLPAAGSGGSVADLATHLAWLAVVVGAIVWQQVGSPIGNGVPVLDPALWSSWLPFLLVLILVEVAFELWRYRAGRWTARLAVTNVALATVSTATVVYLCVTDRLFNPDAMAQGDTVSLGFLNGIIAVSAVAMAVWDSFDGWRKARSA